MKDVKNTDEADQQTFGQILENSKPKLLAIYYSMHNCPPCREFTPMLEAIYEEVNEEEKVLEIIFFSGDKTQEEFDEYYGGMPWLALPRNMKKIMMDNAKRFKVKGVPRLVMLRVSDGEILSYQCYEKVRDQGPMAIEEFLE
jgi:nucleoredoxin